MINKYASRDPGGAMTPTQATQCVTQEGAMAPTHEKKKIHFENY